MLLHLVEDLTTMSGTGCTSGNLFHQKVYNDNVKFSTSDSECNLSSI